MTERKVSNLVASQWTSRGFGYPAKRPKAGETANGKKAKGENTKWTIDHSEKAF
jgi:hypothetical protein